MVSSKYVTGIGMIIIAVIAFAIGLFASPAIIPPAAAGDPVWDNIVKTGKIRAGTEPGWEPYEFLNSTGQIVGFEIELTEMIAKKLNLTVEWHNVGFDQIILSVQAKDLDLGVSGFSVTAERLEVVEFTMPHSITRGQIIMLESRKNALGITTMFTSLKNLTDYNKPNGLTCGTQTGTTEEAELLASGIPTSLVKSYTTFVDAFNAMGAGTIDCVYAETPVTSSWITKLGAEVPPKPATVIYDIPYFPVAFMANKQAHVFVDKINGALSAIIGSGELDALREKWHA